MRFGRLALRCWLLAIGLFVAAFLVGIVAAAVGPGDDSVQTWAWLIFPAVISLVSTPLLVAAVVLAIRSLAVEGANPRAIIALVLAVLALLPLGLIFVRVALLLTGNG